MLELRKPDRLHPGDTVATVSLSWGGAGDEAFLWRYQLGKRRLEEEFSLRVVEMPHTLAGSDFLDEHPEKRAQDLMEAFQDPKIKGIISCIGGNDSIRMLPYIDFEVIRENPKIFMGYSDSTISHFICLHAGLSSIYGPSILAEFAENVEIYDYTRRHVERALFSAEPLGEIEPSAQWTGEYLEWTEANKHRRKTMRPNGGYACINGKGVVRGRLIGGCVEVLEELKGTMLWPSLGAFEDAILFFETSEEMMPPSHLARCLRNYAAQGILQLAYGVVWAKPCNERYEEEYKQVIRQIVTEYDLVDTPILYNASFGHNEPMCCIPYGALCEIDCDARAFRILESAVE